MDSPNTERIQNLMAAGATDELLQKYVECSVESYVDSKVCDYMSSLDEEIFKWTKEMANSEAVQTAIEDYVKKHFTVKLRDPKCWECSSND